MRYEELRMTNIKGFKDRVIRFSPGLNIVFGPNESGKSTALESMLATLFGLSREAVSGFISHGQMQGSVALTFSPLSDETCTIERTYTKPLAFSETIRMTTRWAIDEVAPDDVGRVLDHTIGFSDRVVFENTMVIRQDEIETLLRLDLKSKLKNHIEENLSGVPNRTADQIIVSLAESITTNKAELEAMRERKAFLEAHLKSYDAREKLYLQKKGNREFVKNLLREKEDEYAGKKGAYDMYVKQRELEKSLAENERERNEARAQILAVENSERLLSETSEHIPTLRELGRLLEDERKTRELLDRRAADLKSEDARNGALEEKLSSIDRDIREIEEELGKNPISRKLDSMRKSKEFTYERKKRLESEREALMNEYQALRHHIETLGIYIDTNRKDIEMITFKKNNLRAKLPESMRNVGSGDISNMQEKMRREHQELVSAGDLAVLKGTLEAAEKRKAYLEGEREKMASFSIAIEDFDSFEEAVSQLEIIINHNREILGRLEGEIAPLERELALSKEKANEELQALETKKKAYEESVKVDEKTREFLESANAEVKERLLPELENSVAQMMSRITQGRYTDVRIDKETLDLHILSSETGTYHSTDFLSQGTRDQLYLCVRIAFTEFLTGSKGIPFIFDDPFDSFDDERLRGALQILQEISARHQVILFTHNKACREYGSVVELP